jgi:DNA polymerase
MTEHNNCIEILKLVKTYLVDNLEWDEDELFISNNLIRLEELKQIVINCRNCKLGNERLNIVFGVGNEEAKLMFIGEAPGYEEDHCGEPFIGRAGQLLTKIIESINYKRQDVYITNIVKCHPMINSEKTNDRYNNRVPTTCEIKYCKKYLKQQINIIQPKVIVTLGNVATKGLLNIDDNISRIRGVVKKYNGISVIPTYHPAALLRNNYLKKYVWQDMKQVTKELS